MTVASTTLPAYRNDRLRSANPNDWVSDNLHVLCLHHDELRSEDETRLSLPAWTRTTGDLTMRIRLIALAASGILVACAPPISQPIHSTDDATVAQECADRGFEYFLRLSPANAICTDQQLDDRVVKAQRFLEAHRS